MNQKHRLLCESWVEKRPEVNYVTSHGTSSSKQSIKWKTRYAMLVVSSETKLGEVRFYQKKPRSCTEITDDIIKLQSWQYIVDIPSWIVDKGRPHVLRLRLLPESVVPGQHYQLQIAYQSSEEATAWMRCIQNQTKLTSGIQGHSFGVVAEECSATARVGVAGKHCLLFVGPTQVILAHKTDRSVVCVWPFEAIRSYATDDDRRLVLEAGRCAPLGEGVYSFRTRENDDNVLFDLFDHYTTTATVEPPKSYPKSRDLVARNSDVGSSQTKSEPIIRLQNVQTPRGQKHPTRQDSDRLPLISRHSSDDASKYGEPPKKPPLPISRAPLPGVTAQESPIVPAKTNKTSSGKNSKVGHKGVGTKQTDRCLYELDKLLHNLEDDIHSSKENILHDDMDLSKGGTTSLDARDWAGHSSRMGEDETGRNGAAALDDKNPTAAIDSTVPYAKVNCSKKKIESTND